MSNSTSSVNTAFYITPKPKSNPHFNSTSSRFITFTSPNHRTNKPWNSWRSTRKSLSTVKNVATDQQSVAAAELEEQGVILRRDSKSIASNIKYHAEFSPSFSPEIFDLPKAYAATAQSVRDELIANWNATYDCYEKTNMKQAYYLSMEFLQGRALLNAIGNLELSGEYEPDAALGNGGLGRLASCFLDSLATLNYPAWGYGLRYKYGLFKQNIATDGQEEVAEGWLEMGHPWEIIRNDVSYNVKFYGKIAMGSDGKKHWVGGETIKAFAYDVPIPGYKTKTTINLRLWSTRVTSEGFDLDAFNSGDHVKAFEAQANAEKIVGILFNLLFQVLHFLEIDMLCIVPGGESMEGKTLRLKQQYTLCSASLQDIVARFERRSGSSVNWEDFPDKVAVQMNDTHPTLCIPILPEALEKWSLDLMQKLLPRHVEIIELVETRSRVAGEKIQAMRILDNVELPATIKEVFAKAEFSAADTDEENFEKNLLQTRSETTKVGRMANLSIAGGHAVNGVAAIHSEIVKEEVFNDFYKMWPDKFQNKTNGVTPRRWIRFCNPDLSNIITKWTGTESWVLDTEKLAELRKFADNEDLHAEWKAAKKSNKIKAASYIKEKTGYSVSPDAMFDVQKRKEKFAPRVCIFGGKHSLHMYKLKVVKFIVGVGATINRDSEIGDLFEGNVIFVPDYNVSVAKCLFLPLNYHSTSGIVGALLSNINTAGMEASGTSNMKFSMNGCVLIGTLDGANVEIREEVGDDNFFLFGAEAHEITKLRKERTDGKWRFWINNYDELMGSLEGSEGYGRADYFLVGKDFPSYIECQDKVDGKWTRMSIMNTAGSYKFSSDRTIREYAKDIWNIEPVELP
ncbi:hypothetical protein MKW92_041514 [Papaver armeniacum]|nr:hypothetical protein MKW92_041514 [Papaver armeniacum]